MISNSKFNLACTGEVKITSICRNNEIKQTEN